MMTILKPSKMKLIAMALIWVAMWAAHRLEDAIGDPLIRKASPQFSVSVGKLERQIDNAKGNEETDYVTAGAIALGAEWGSRALVAYLCACAIIAASERKRSPNNAAQSTSPKGAEPGR